MSIRTNAAQRIAACVAVLSAMFGLIAVAEGADTGQDAGEFFEKQVRPILAQRCFGCHSGKLMEGIKDPRGGLRLDSRAAALKGGDTGPAVVPGDLKNSLLIDSINYGEVYQMPPKNRLPAEEVAILTKWVEQGAPWPAEPSPMVAENDHEKVFNLAQRKAEHWCWQPVRSPELPTVASDWIRQPLDRFILARLEQTEKGLSPAPPADKRTLIRRASFDLIGLPPTPAEVAAFLADDSPLAFEKVVDRLLASPHFGERWGRHWLDLVRYAESRGHEFEPNIPNAWQYRDYVIRAINADVPYDQFVREHLAGDLLENPRQHPSAGWNESILGTGFWFLGEEVHSPVDIRKDETDRLDNRLDVMTKTFLGVTVACARCHDHKFDAISQRDYYALQGYLISGGYRQIAFESLEQNRRAAAQWAELRESARDELLRLTLAAEQPVLDHLAEYLLAARAPLEAGVQKHKLDAALQGRWTAELAQAKGDLRHPLHAFAVLAQQSAAKAEDRAKQLAALAAELQPAETKGGAAFDPAQVVVDYTVAGGAWFQDGFSFGPRPVQIGDVRWGESAAKPILGLYEYSAAERDSFWKGIQLAPGTDKDHGQLGAWDRAGQTIRTPETRLHQPRLWYLVKGSGRAYAAVNSHLVIAGPLHGALLTEWKGAADDWRWVAHSLDAYRGNRLHVEFSPLGDDPLSIAMVVQAESQPPLPFPQAANGLLAAELRLNAEGADERSSPEKVAEACQRLARRIASDLLANRGGETKLSRDEAHWGSWLVSHPDLFSDAASEPRRALLAASETFVKKISELSGQRKKESHTALAMFGGNQVAEQLLIRGNSKTPGVEVPPRFLEAVAASQPTSPSGSSRLELAGRVVDPANPLTARVMVNRLWHHLLGRGIVSTVDNFGVLGEKPTHPELLDFLAHDFVQDGWSVKRAIRRIMLSNTYQQASTAPGQMSLARADEVDPQNLLFHRANVRRLEGEAIRDSLLAISGRLDPQPFGPSVPIHLTEFMQGRGRPGVSGPLDGAGRRSIYISVRRNFLSPFMLAFDTPIPFSTVGRRNLSNVPAQALILMNDPFVVEQAKVWSRKLLVQPGQSLESRISQMYEAAFARPPTEKETTAAVEFLSFQAREYQLSPERMKSDERVWADLAHILFNVKEFVFLY